MSRLPRLLGGMVLLLAALCLSRAVADNGTDPLPLRRILLSSEQLASPLGQVREGTLVRLSRPQFEQLLDQARRHQDRPRCQLSEVLYRASLVEEPDARLAGGSAALVGTAQWKILPGDSRSSPAGQKQLALLILDPPGGFNLAVEQARLGDRDAQLVPYADPTQQGKRTQALIVDGPGEQTATFDWSARAERRPDGLHVELRLPSSPAGAFELELPANRSVSVPDGTVVAGPYPAANAERRLWRIACGGRTLLPLLIHHRAVGSTATVLYWHKTTQQLSQEGLRSTTSLTLETRQPAVLGLLLAYDAPLSPLEVSGLRVRRWDKQAYSGYPGGRLLIEFDRPVRETSVEILSIAPLPSNEAPRRTAPWSSPGMRVLHCLGPAENETLPAISRGETLELLLQPEVRLLSWQPGDFRLTDSTRTTAESGQPLQRLILSGGGLSSGDQPRRPGGLLQVGGVEFLARQQLWWRLLGEMELTAQITYEVRQGQIFQLATRLPPGWQVDTVELSPAELLAGWRVRPENVPGKPTQPILFVDLRHPLQNDGKGANGVLTVRLRQPGGWVGRDLPLPDVEPLGARHREGVVGISYDESLYQARRGGAWTAQSSGQESPVGPWGSEKLASYLPFKGTSLSGTLQLRPLPPRLQAQADSTLLVRAGQLLLDSRLTLRALSGSVDRVDVSLSAPLPGLPTFTPTTANPQAVLTRVERLTGRETAQLLSGLAASTPMEAVALQLARPPGSLLRLYFDRPLPVGQEVALSSTMALPEPVAAGGLCAVPLLWVAGAERFAGQITLEAINRQGLAIASRVGLTELPSPGGVSQRYRESSASLTLRGRPSPSARSEGLIDRARLVSWAPLPGAQSEEVRHHFRFQVRNWPLRLLPVRLPPSARLVTAAVAGRWLEQLPPLQSDQVVHLPVPAGPEGHWLEIVYASPAAWVGPALRLPLEQPALPLAPVQLERLWLLPPGVVPLDGSTLTRRPGLPASNESATPVERLLGLFQFGPSAGLLQRLDERHSLPEQALSAAVQSLYSEEGGKQRSLGRWVRELANRHLGPALPLLIDRTALESRGLGPDTQAAVRSDPSQFGSETETPPFTLWQDEELLLVPTRAGVLLTTQSAWAVTGSESPAVLRLLQQARRWGQDSTGRIVLWSEWLPGAAAREKEPSLLQDREETVRSTAEAAWTVWEVQAGADNGAVLLLIRDQVSTVVGVFLAGLMLAIFVGLPGPWGPGRRWGLLLTLGLWILGVTWLPASLIALAWWPMLVTLLLAGGWYLSWASRRVVWPASSSTIQQIERPGSAAPAAAEGPGSATFRALLPALCFGAGLATLGQGQPAAAPEAEPVFLVPGTAPNDPGSVLIRPELEERLRRRGQQAPGTDSAVLIRAHYDGTVIRGEGGGDRAEFTTTLQAYHFVEGPTLLPLPLGGVQLVGDLLINGVQALPVVVPAGGPAAGKEGVGYAVRLRGKGQHKIELRFQVPVGHAVDGLQQVRFRTAPLAQSRLMFQMPPGAQLLEAINRQGMQRITKVADREVLQADLGPVNTPVLIRWLQAGDKAPTPSRPLVEFREAHLWDLRPDSSRLTSLIQYTISQAGVSSVQVELPAQLEVQSVKARRPMQPGSATAAENPGIRLTNWVIEEKPRVLRLEFATPISGVLEVELELIPRDPWSSSVLLPLPRPLGQPATPGRTDDQATSYLAYRNPGLSATARDWLRLSGIKREDFAPFWPAATRPAPSSLTEASRFRREAGQDPELRLQLQPASSPVRVAQEVQLQVGSVQAELLARIDLETTDRDLSLLEWEIRSPLPLAVVQVTGPDISRWSRAGNRLLVWLNRNRAKTRVEITGWLPLRESTRGKDGQPGPAELELPCLRLLQAESSRTRLTLFPQPGLSLTPQALQQLIPAASTDARQRPYQGNAAEYAGTFLVRREPAPQVAAVTHFSVKGKDLLFSTQVDYRQAGEISQLEVRLPGWPGEARLDSLSGSILRQQEQVRSESGRGAEKADPARSSAVVALRCELRIWKLDIKPGTAGQFRFSVSGRLPLQDSLQRLIAPVLQVGSATLQHQIITPIELFAEGNGTVRLVPKAQARVQAQQGDFDLPEQAQLWQATGDDWQLELFPRPVSTAQTPARLILAELQASVADGVCWQQKVTLWLWHEGPLLLGTRWPQLGRLMEVTVDGEAVQSLEGMRLFLTGRGGRKVVLRYQLDGRRDLSRPPLRLPAVDLAIPGQDRPGTVLSPQLRFWTVQMPTGWQLERGDGQTGPLTGPTRQASLQLHRAAALQAFIQLSGEEAAADTTAFARRLAEYCQRAGWALEATTDGNRILGPQGQTLPRWLESLRARAVSEKQPTKDEVGVRGSAPGLLASWSVLPTQSNAEEPTVRLMPIRRAQERAALQLWGQCLIGLLLIALVSMSHALRTIARWLWPEQLLVLGLIGWQAAGPTLVVLLLIGLGILSRLLLVSVGISRVLRWSLAR